MPVKRTPAVRVEPGIYTTWLTHNNLSAVKNSCEIMWQFKSLFYFTGTLV